MKNIFSPCIILIIILSLFISIPLFAETNPIVQVDPVINLSDEVWLDAVCDAATDNVLFTLKFLGQFEVISDMFVEKEIDQLENIELLDQKTFDTSSLKTRAEQEGYDNILFGSCTIEDGSYVITMNAYDLALDKITYSGSTVVESIFDTFEAVDEITYQTVEGFSGIHVTYGSLVLVPPDTGEPFNFTIDGIALPEGIFSVERMPAGVHELAVWQERPLGLYEAVHEIVVVEEKENKKDIPLPAIVGEEISIFNQADRYLTLVSMRKRSGTVLEINNLNDLLETPFFQDYRLGIVRKYARWGTLLGQGIEEKNEIYHEQVNFPFQSLWNKEMAKQVYTKNTSLSSNYKVYRDQGEFDRKNNMIPDIATINIDGKDDDWISVTSGWEDPVGDLDMSKIKDAEGYDLVEAKLAIDRDYLYIMMRSKDGKYLKNDLVHKMNLSSIGSMFFDIHLYEEDNLNMGYYMYEGGKNTPSIKLNSRVKLKTGDIFEMAIPLDTIIKSPLFVYEMGLLIVLEYHQPGKEETPTVDKIDLAKKITFPLLEVLTRKE